MCQFFSCVSDGNGNVTYFDAKQRRQIKSGKLKDKSDNDYIPDSHSSIAALIGKVESDVNCWEYNPVTKKLVKDRSPLADDSRKVKAAIKNLDFPSFAPNLRGSLPEKLDPFRAKGRKRVTPDDLKLLKEFTLAYTVNCLYSSVPSKWFRSDSFYFKRFAEDIEGAVKGRVKGRVKGSCGMMAYLYVRSLFTSPTRLSKATVALWGRGLYVTRYGNVSYTSTFQLYGPGLIWEGDRKKLDKAIAKTKR